MMHWYFMLIVMGNPVQFGPFTEEKCNFISERYSVIFKDEITEGKISKVECWQIVGA